MSAVAAEVGAINLSQGFPDFNCDEKLLKLASGYMNQGFNQYAPMPGALPLRECIAHILSHCYGASYSPDTEITVTAGATQAIYTALVKTYGVQLYPFFLDGVASDPKLNDAIVPAMSMTTPTFVVASMTAWRLWSAGVRCGDVTRARAYSS